MEHQVRIRPQLFTDDLNFWPRLLLKVKPDFLAKVERFHMWQWCEYLLLFTQDDRCFVSHGKTITEVRELSKQGVVQVFSDHDYLLALTDDQRLFSWIRLYDDQSRPVVIATGVLLVSLYYGDAALIDTEGHVWCWNSSSRPVRLEQSEKFIDVQCNRDYILALTVQGQLYIWQNMSKKQGLGTPTLVNLQANITKPVALGAIDLDTFVIATSDGKIFSCDISDKYSMRVVAKSLMSFEQDNVAVQATTGEYISLLSRSGHYRRSSLPSVTHVYAIESAQNHGRATTPGLTTIKPGTFERLDRLNDSRGADYFPFYDLDFFMHWDVVAPKSPYLVADPDCLVNWYPKYFSWGATYSLAHYIYRGTLPEKPYLAFELFALGIAVQVQSFQALVARHISNRLCDFYREERSQLLVHLAQEFDFFPYKIKKLQNVLNKCKRSATSLQCLIARFLLQRAMQSCKPSLNISKIFKRKP